MPVPAPGVPGRACGRLGVGPEGVPPGRGAEVEGRSSCRATGAGVGAAGRGAPGRAEAGVALRVIGPGMPGDDGVGALRVEGAVLGAGGVRVDGAEDSAAGRGVGALGAAGVRVDGADDSAGVRGPGAPGRGPEVSGREGTAGRGALGVAVVGLGAAVVLGAAGTALRAAGAAGAGRCAGASAGASFSRRRRITGASRVDEGDLTNSPMSLAIERTALLSTPSSLASS
ncbi:hypothetical protein GCM10022197_41200 [Microlunatus spumicola]|uniref:Uncharacterized protein n=1 Tax=Microlunatus spumicola TaxID=81499 RepID=A0ABP6YAT3_9ACTN